MQQPHYSFFWRQFRTAVFVVALVSVGASGIAGAAMHSYRLLNDHAQPGMLLSQATDSGVAELTTNKNAGLLLGVYSTGSSTLDQQPGQITIDTEGQASTLVSTLNGDIKVGDRIGVSSLSGIGAKATTSGWIVGVAQGSLDAKTVGAVKSTVTDTSGVKHKVSLVSMPVVIHVTYFAVPGSTAGKSSTAVPSSVQAIADTVAGKHASLISLILSFLLLLIGFVVVGIMVNAAIRGSMDALARQPLSKRIVNKALVRSLGLAAAVVVGVLLGALLLLRVV